jgi:hypothetical protein
MKDRLMLIAIIAALLVSSTSLVVSLAPLYQTKSESGTLPPEVFSALAGRRAGTGAGTFSLNDGQSTVIYADIMTSAHTVTGTVTNELTSTGNLNVTVYSWGSYLLTPGNSITGTWTISGGWVVVQAIGGHVDGYYWGSFFPS